jgi:hypothetical protein
MALLVKEFGGLHPDENLVAIQTQGFRAIQPSGLFRVILGWIRAWFSGK